MTQCRVCGSQDFHEGFINEIFNIDGKFQLVENIPAKICSRCSEPIFSRGTTERVRELLHQDLQPARSIQVGVYAFS